jgi:mRNA interferase MazF
MSATKALAARLPAKSWVPDRQDIIWIDHNPQAGREMRDFHPLLVLSPKAFNASTGLVIGLPMSTAPYNATNPFAVKAGRAATKTKTQADSYVLCHQPKSFDWRMRGGKPHPSKRLDDATLSQACLILNQLIDIA